MRSTHSGLLIIAFMAFLGLAHGLGAQSTTDSTWAITFVEVTHNSKPVYVAKGLTPVQENWCTRPSTSGEPPSPNVANVNQGIGGDKVGIWVTYKKLPVDSDEVVLVDIAVAHWPNWDRPYPCPTGFVPAAGDARLTAGTKNACNRNGLCVKYKQLREADESTIVSALYLSRGTDSNIAKACGNTQCAVNEGSWPMTAMGEDIHKGCGSEPGGPTWVYLCRNRENTKAGAAPKDFTSISAEEKLRIVEQFAPRIHMAKEEIYFPSDVEWSFANTVRFKNGDGKYWLKTRTDLASASDTLPYFKGFTDVSRAPVYAFLVDKTETAPVADIVYFTYYPYNFGKPVLGQIWGSHVGDWEHVTVRVGWHYSGAAWQVKGLAVYLPYHSGGETVSWDDMDKINNHPVAYAAWGSHGVWRTVGEHTYMTGLNDYTSKGQAWDTWNRILAWDFRTREPLSKVPWPAWMSAAYTDPGGPDPANPTAGPLYRWGNPSRYCEPVKDQCVLEDGPTGPPDKKVWAPGVIQ